MRKDGNIGGTAHFKPVPPATRGQALAANCNFGYHRIGDLVVAVVGALARLDATRFRVSAFPKGYGATKRGDDRPDCTASDGMADTICVRNTHPSPPRRDEAASENADREGCDGPCEEEDAHLHRPLHSKGKGDADAAKNEGDKGGHAASACCAPTFRSVDWRYLTQ